MRRIRSLERYAQQQSVDDDWAAEQRARAEKVRVVNEKYGLPPYASLTEVLNFILTYGEAPQEPEQHNEPREAPVQPQQQTQAEQAIQRAVPV
jgi:hypothetical protein